MVDTFTFNEKVDFRSVGKAIKKARIASRWTQEQTAEKLGISIGHLSAIENQGKPLGGTLLIRLMKLFGFSLDSCVFNNSENQDNKSDTRRQIDLIISTATAEELKYLLDVYMAYKECKNATAED